MDHRTRYAAASRRAAFWIAQLGGWGAYGLSTFLTLLPALPEGERGAYLAAKLLRAAVGLAASLLLLPLYRFLRGRGAPPWAIVAAALVACGALGAGWLLVYRLGIAPALLSTPPPFGWDIFPRAALDLAFVLLAWSGIYFGALHWQTIQEQERRVLEARRLEQEARFHMLSHQLNPHFLFNSLNSIRALIEEDRERAREMVTEFAELLRYTLTRDPSRHVTVRQEFEAVDHYLSIEGIRFEGRIDSAARVGPDAAGCLIPGFLVHPLVENAVKYGARSAGCPLRIRIDAAVAGERLRIEVANSGTLRPGADRRGDPGAAAPHGTGLGWRSIRGRLEHLYPGEYRFDVAEREGWVRARIEIPAVREDSGLVHHA